jgi:peptidoglycan/xylan/chitin deacetylase (PgdA/CDA1 family)
MPRKARLVIVLYAGAYLLVSALVLSAATRLFSHPWTGWIAGALLLALALVLLDAFYPRVSLFLPSVRRIPQDRKEKTIALTFDDGPVSPYTEQILDILDRYGVKASFFCIGENVRRHPRLAREILNRGHTLGNHTHTHRSLLLASAGTVARELDDAQCAIRKACGFEPVFFRCPKGYKSPIVARVLRRRRLVLVAYGYPVWDVQNPPATDLIGRVLKRAAPGDIVVMHDGFPPQKPGKRDSLVAALPVVIEGLLGQGIRPVSLDHAIGR